MIRYISTRGDAPALGFYDATLAGLASDGGLYVPDACPLLQPGELETMARAPYLDVALRVIEPFTAGEMTAAELKPLLQAAYQKFTHPDIAPLRQMEDGLYMLELFHGPTLAFKDVALQFLGQLFGHVLARKKQRVTIVGATSGDTGSAAIEAFRGRDNVDIFILHPRGRVSEVQRRQMTAVIEPNVHNIAIEGSFDYCQDLVKAMFNDARFRADMNLSAVNSINWARILAQVVYYVFAASRLGQGASFCVPTGNFGNIYAGYVAQSMRAPVGRLIAATNRNDILHRFFETGEMRRMGVEPSLSPSMDIQVSSNFERLLFDLYGRSGFAVKQTMGYFADTGPFRLDADMMQRVRGVFASGRQDDAQTLDVMKKTHADTGILLDPHTAVGVGVAQAYRKQHPDETVVTLATAHPAKFPDAVKRATGKDAPLPPALADLFDRPEKCDVLAADLSLVQKFVRERVRK